MDFLWREESQRGNPGNVFTTSCFKKRCWGGLKIDWGGLRALAHSLAGVKTPANRGALKQIVPWKSHRELQHEETEREKQYSLKMSGSQQAERVRVSLSKPNPWYNPVGYFKNITWLLGGSLSPSESDVSRPEAAPLLTAPLHWWWNHNEPHCLLCSGLGPNG